MRSREIDYVGGELYFVQHTRGRWVWLVPWEEISATGDPHDIRTMLWLRCRKKRGATTGE